MNDDNALSKIVHDAKLGALAISLRRMCSIYNELPGEDVATVLLAVGADAMRRAIGCGGASERLQFIAAKLLDPQIERGSTTFH
jgi:hypothetical protein